MAFYKITLHRFQRGSKLDWEQEVIIQSTLPPKLGQGNLLLVHPPISEQVASVQRLCNRRKYEIQIEKKVL